MIKKAKEENPTLPKSEKKPKTKISQYYRKIRNAIRYAFEDDPYINPHDDFEESSPIVPLQLEIPTNQSIHIINPFETIFEPSIHAQRLDSDAEIITGLDKQSLNRENRNHASEKRKIHKTQLCDND